MISKNGQYEAIRLSMQEVQVSCIKGRNIYTSYIIMATASGTIGHCSCAYGRRPGTTCPHMDLVRDLVAAEQAPVVVEVKRNAFQQWLQQQEEEGIVLFASC